MITLDGSRGEGGGQILRTALALSVHTGTAFRIRNIRKGRQKPGLLRQHLTGVRAAAEISDATVLGDELGSTELEFAPGRVRSGDFRFAVGTAGSANLVLQTVLWPLALASGVSRLVLEGGTHNSASPPYHFLEQVFAPILAKAGVGLQLTLDRWGFYPAGGGRIVAEITPGALTAIDLTDRGPVEKIDVFAAVSALPESIANRELMAACKRLGCDRRVGQILEAPSPGPGNVIWVVVRCAGATELFTGFGEKGVPAERVGDQCAREASAWIEADVPVGEHLADQLLLPMALAGGGTFRTVEPTLHTRTNIEVIRAFLGTTFDVREDAGAWRVSV